MHLAIPTHDVLVIILKNADQCFHDIYMPISNSIFTSNNDINLYVTKIASKKLNLEHKCILQES